MTKQKHPILKNLIEKNKFASSLGSLRSDVSKLAIEWIFKKVVGSEKAYFSLQNLLIGIQNRRSNSISLHIGGSYHTDQANRTHEVLDFGKRFE